jgi:hypothetical protein
MATQVTTAARRIAQTLNGNRPGWRYAFDAEGRVLSRVYGPEPSLPQPEGTRYTFECGDRGRRIHHTYREIQNAMDERDRPREPIEIDRETYWV